MRAIRACARRVANLKFYEVLKHCKNQTRLRVGLSVSVMPARNSCCNSKWQVYKAGVSKGISKETGDGAALVSERLGPVTKVSGYQRGYQANRLPWCWCAQKAMVKAMQVQAVNLSKPYLLRYCALAVLM